MKQTAQKLLNFFDKINKESVGINFEIEEGDLLELIHPSSEKVQQIFNKISQKIETKCNLVFRSEESKIVYLCVTELTWSRPETISKEGFLDGGFVFNGLSDIFYFRSDADFWKSSLADFLKFENESKTDIDLIKKVQWIESSTRPMDQVGTPHFGCVTFNDPSFPSDYYFYDSGLVYKLPFRSYPEYIDALIKSAGIKCWQYFYISPEEIISKNKNIHYSTWPLHTGTCFEEEYKRLAPVKQPKYDRLDLINEYLERCIRLLPGSFPFIDFTHHKEYYKKLKTLYKATKL